MSLEENLCLVTGASSGIGLAICQVLNREGGRVVGTGRQRDVLAKLKEEGIVVDFVVADLTADGECERVVKEAVRILGGLTTVVNAAGILRGGAVGSESVDLSNYDANMATNARAPFEIMIHSVPYLRRNRDGNPSIVNVSSVNGKRSFAGCASYCMSKAALDMLTRCASVDLAKDGIRVNAVNPGVIETNLQRSGGMSEEQYAAFVRRSVDTTHPLASSLGRVGTPLEVGELVSFLVSKRARFLTGECIAIDGGRQNLGAR